MQSMVLVYGEREVRPCRNMRSIRRCLALRRSNARGGSLEARGMLGGSTFIAMVLSRSTQR